MELFYRIPMNENDLEKLPEFLNFSPPSLSGDELAELSDTLDSGWITKGPKTERFEKEIGSFIKTESALAVSSCTAAMHLALRVLGVGEGDGVITSPLTFVSTAHAIVYTGATPFFCDIDPQNGNIDPRKILRFLKYECEEYPEGILRHKKTDKIIKALLPVHYGGFPVNLSMIQTIANNFNLHILEDAAHAMGSYYKGQHIGSDSLRSNMNSGLHQLSAFSFYATKNLTTGEGGLLTGPAELIEKARVLSAYGISDARHIWDRRYSPKGTWFYDVESLGFKNNFTDIQAALGLAQLRNFVDNQRIRARYAEIYTDTLKPLKSLVRLPKADDMTTPAWHLYPLRLNLSRLYISRNEFIEKLKNLNIGTSVMFIPVHTFTYYSDLINYKKLYFPQAQRFYACEISLPMSPKLPEEMIKKAAILIRDLILCHAK
ncbi:MAG: DegT/DnrJ/EryC1/StrS aminotransferase family protein [Deltaproteobacteria bacterium]|nr:DegT/DnrJ/EryC1/StrS aminotransferase family protein [Deltaproteobacteria bacterium]